MAINPQLSKPEFDLASHFSKGKQIGKGVSLAQKITGKAINEGKKALGKTLQKYM
jgi:hypothetical protein